MEVYRTNITDIAKQDIRDINSYITNELHEPVAAVNTLTFKCTHGYYRQVNMGKITGVPPNADEYFGRCAGGRLYELQKALGIKLKIKSVDVTPLTEKLDNPVVFTYEIVN